jgi:Big-like domain-containing protein
MRIHQAWALLGLLASVANAGAQPAVFALLTPAPNEAGWLNSPVRVDYACARAAVCPQPEVITTEGAQPIAATVRDGDGVERTVSAVLNIDYTTPAVIIESPPPGYITTSPLVMVVAHASDALSGLASATCNGIKMPIAESGRIQCMVVLEPGMNDIVVEVSDHASNSGSAGLRALLRGASSRLRVVPEAAGVLIGSSRTFQVLDEFGLDVPEVVWLVDNPALAEISADGHILTAKAPGSVVLKATAGGMTATAFVTIFTGDRLPPNSIRWKVDSLTTTQTADTQPLVPSERRWVATHQAPGGVASVESINMVSGRLNWRMRPAVSSGDAIATVREQLTGGAVMVVERQFDGTFSLVRGGEIKQGAPWRYRSAGTIGADVVMHGDGAVSFMETLPSGFSRFVGISGDHGVVLHRVSLPSGVHIAMNVGCIAGANAAREVPAQVGPVTATPEGPLVFPIVVSDDREDFEQCGGVTGRLKRTVYMARIGANVRTVESMRVYDVPAGSKPPTVTLFPVGHDGRGGLLMAWAAVDGDTGVRESRMAHISESGRQEYTLPTAGELFLVGTNDDALMTDGTRLVVFNIFTGAVRWNHFDPAGVRVIEVKHGKITTQTHDNKLVSYNSDGRPIPGKP